jgi:hypothetical protein
MAFDEKIHPDIGSVLNAAALLDITEYDLFHLAYARWHGERADEGTMEPFFVAYMFEEVVPIWARHFARLVERLSNRGTLDRRALGVHRLPHTQQMVKRGVRYSIIIVLALMALIVLAEFAAKLMHLGERCMFPPCY